MTTWSALLRGGYTAAHVKAQIVARRWRRWGYAIVLHNGPLTRTERWHVARLHGGRGALLTSFTAAEAYGLRGWEREDVYVLGKPGARASTRCPVAMRMHRATDWAEVRRAVDGPTHLISQALILTSTDFRSPRAACGILAAAVQQRLATADRLRGALEAATRIRHRAVLLRAMDDIAQGAQALSEVDGALHRDQRNWWSDQARQNALVLADAIVLRYPSVVVRTQPELVAAELRRALGI